MFLPCQPKAEIRFLLFINRIGRKVLLKILSNVRLFAKQALPLWGDGGESNFIVVMMTLQLTNTCRCLRKKIDTLLLKPRGNGYKALHMFREIVSNLQKILKNTKNG